MASVSNGRKKGSVLGISFKREGKGILRSRRFKREGKGILRGRRLMFVFPTLQVGLQADLFRMEVVTVND